MIRVAILGAGIGREHLAAFRALPDQFEVAAVVDTDRNRIEEIRDGMRFAALSDINDVLNDPAIDLVDVCLPPHLHVPITLAALAADKHVVCEKPIAPSLTEVNQLKEAQRKSRGRVFPVFQYRWGPACAQLRHLIDLGLCGAPHSAALETHWHRDASYYAPAWRGTWAGENGGAVLGHAIHNHDLLTYFLGPVQAVSAMVATRVNAIETEDCAALSFTMANGALATSSITLGAATDETRLRFVFDRLTVTSGHAPYAPGSVPWTFTARDPAQQAEIGAAVQNTPKTPTGFHGFFNEIAKAINGLPNSSVSLKEGADSIALVTAIYHAARTGERVALPLAPTHPLYEGWQP